MKRILAFIILLCFAAAGLGFAVLNAGDVQLNYYFGEAVLPLALVVVGALAVGALLGLLSAAGMLLARKHESNRLRRRLRLAEQEIRNIRELPVRDSH
ncbi:lipopolysaccharide assembly protein LapA domain-containing protein [Thiohalomonas denitrificans]|uniref:Uncharacterized integral membrane protein n=1 Tax=Thiohalomonas denitrificans TaxID=415747 RepID=A0A1G5PI70_9GAMM|nr:lipopolysaccharide assembly protein LapA domain-containing protein [Thiohalomonas denitrificans]SCZ49194.1 Uncharacterized integral membrane protein [Thiohalomonas denitrificans]